MSTRPSQPPVEVIPAAKRLVLADAGFAIMKSIAQRFARQGLDAATIRSRMATYASVAAEQAIAWAAEQERRADGDDAVPA